MSRLAPIVPIYNRMLAISLLFGIIAMALVERIAWGSLGTGLSLIPRVIAATFVAYAGLESSNTWLATPRRSPWSGRRTSPTSAKSSSTALRSATRSRNPAAAASCQHLRPDRHRAHREPAGGNGYLELIIRSA
jgi:hypothetical protein